MKIASIGNSFSQDAQRYLHGIARAGGVDMKCVNLCIGGCSLARHYRNMLAGDDMYDFELNGNGTGLKVSLKTGLFSDFFDIVTIQQLSGEAPRYETYQPYLDELVAYVRRAQPRAKIYLQQTWFYEQGSRRLCEEQRFATEADMYAALREAYSHAAEAIGAKIIPSAAALMHARSLGAEKLHRDTYHASRGLGRYILSLVWYGALTGRDFADNGFRDFDEPISEEEVALAKQAARTALLEYGYTLA